MFYQQFALARSCKVSRSITRSKQSAGAFGLIWLASQLGLRSTVRKLQKKDVLETDVQEICEKIGMPEEPLALRLSAALLFGVARVYSQQVTYFFGDVERVAESYRRMDKERVTANQPSLDMVEPSARARAAITRATPELGRDAFAVDFAFNDFGMALFDEQWAGNTFSQQLRTGLADLGMEVEDAPRSQLSFEPEDEDYNAKKPKQAKRPTKASLNATPTKPKNVLDDSQLNLLPDDHLDDYRQPNPRFDLNFGFDGNGNDQFTFQDDFFGNNAAFGQQQDLQFDNFDTHFDPGFEAGPVQPPTPNRPPVDNDFHLDFGLPGFGLEGDNNQGADFNDPNPIDINQKQTGSAQKPTARPKRKAATLDADQDNEDFQDTEPAKAKKKGKAKRNAATGPIFDRETSLERDSETNGRAAYTALIAEHEREEAQKLLDKKLVKAREQMLHGVPPEFDRCPELRECESAFISSVAQLGKSGSTFAPNRDLKRVRPFVKANRMDSRKRWKRKQIHQSVGLQLSRGKSNEAGPPLGDKTNVDRESDVGVGRRMSVDPVSTNMFGNFEDNWANAFDAGADAFNFDGFDNHKESGLDAYADRESEVGRRDSAGSRRLSNLSQLPWNQPDVRGPGSEHDSSRNNALRLSIRSESPLEGRHNRSRLSASPAHSLTGRRSRGVSFSLDGPASQILHQDTDLGDGLPFTFDESDIAHANLQQESVNFLNYAKTQAEADGRLLFSDIAPLASTAPQVAAQAFYHLLVLSSRQRIQVIGQAEAYGEIELQVAA